MNRTIFLFTSFVIFSVCFLSEEFFIRGHVSPETELARKRDMFVVKQGISQDGRLAILPVNDVQSATIREKIPNRLRNLRVWQGKSRDGSSVVFYVEQFRPRQVFEARAILHVSPESFHFAWTSPTAFMFCGTDPEGHLVRYEIDLHLLELSVGVTERKLCPEVRSSHDSFCK